MLVEIVSKIRTERGDGKGRRGRFRKRQGFQAIARSGKWQKGFYLPQEDELYVEKDALRSTNSVGPDSTERAEGDPRLFVSFPRRREKRRLSGEDFSSGELDSSGSVAGKDKAFANLGDHKDVGGCFGREASFAIFEVEFNPISQTVGEGIHVVSLGKF